MYRLVLVTLLGAAVMGAAVDPKLDFEPAKVVELKDPAVSRERPNIRGIRVTVETNSKGGSTESKSSETDSSDSSSSSDRSSVGVRTDVTFEISGESNETISGEVPRGRGKVSKNETEDDRDVPVVVGRKPDSATTWKPLIRIVPVEPDRGRDSTWFRTLPNSMWTTERAGQYDPNIPRGADSDSYFSYKVAGEWRPSSCKCHGDAATPRFYQTRPHVRPWRPSLSGILEHEVDNKLEKPFH